MPRLLSAALTVEKNRLESGTVLSMLLQVEVPGAGVPYRVVNYDEDIVFHGLPFLRAPFDVDAIEDVTSMALTRLRLTIGNVNQEFQSILENFWGPDSPFTVSVWYPVSMASPDETPFGTGEVFVVAQVATDMVSAVVDLQAAGITLTGTIPKRRFTRSSGFPNIPRRVG
jgi:hypothetical protein